eukprot:1160300-Pelagomonas_calceolata.AAC.5
MTPATRRAHVTFSNEVCACDFSNNKVCLCGRMAPARAVPLTIETKRSSKCKSRASQVQGCQTEQLCGWSNTCGEPGMWAGKSMSELNAFLPPRIHLHIHMLARHPSETHMTAQHPPRLHIGMTARHPSKHLHDCTASI